MAICALGSDDGDWHRLWTEFSKVIYFPMKMLWKKFQPVRKKFFTTQGISMYVKTMNKLMEEEAQSNNGTCFESL